MTLGRVTATDCPPHRNPGRLQMARTTGYAAGPVLGSESGRDFLHA